nr:Fic family protein [Actinomyces sp.]
MGERLYTTRAPWITFTFRTEYNALWAQLGEVFSKCQHLAGTPLQPRRASELASVYVRRGALSTTAIEGNTLTEEDLSRIIDHGESLPPSREYLEQEVRNILEALSDIDTTQHRQQGFVLTPQWLKDQNANILKGLEVADHVTPGEYTTTQLSVGTYRPAPPEDVPYLVERLCQWLNDEYLAHVNNPDTPADTRFFNSFLAATLGHLYVAWIHPFGDGNGRTARLLQVAVLAASGVVPWVSTNLLSDFYNETRSRYYQRLDDASRKGDVAGFVRYSAGGLVDKLREQITEVQEDQRRIAWISYIHEVMHDEPSGKTKDRRRDLALAMPERPLSRREISRLTPDLAAAYVNTERTLTRDLHRLRDLHLLWQPGRGLWASNMAVIDAFKP